MNRGHPYLRNGPMAVFLAVLGVLVILPTTQVDAATGTSGLTVAATIGLSAVGGPLQPVILVSTTSINFGNIFAGSGTPVLAQGSVRVTSTVTGFPIAIRMGSGQNFNAVERRLRKTTLPLAFQSYRIYKDSGRTQEWGGTPFPRGTPLSSTTGTAGTVKVFPAYARTLTPHSTVFGIYSDLVLVSVDF